MDTLAKLPYGTPDFPGCSGRLRALPEDFSVEEIPAYEPSGSGEHVYLWVEKKGISTGRLRELICRAFGVSQGQVGHAGLKDARAHTRQWISVHSSVELPIHSLEDPAVSILRVTRHGNKLRPGHLRGNRFWVAVRDVEIPDRFAELAAILQGEGFPNYFGEQRLGRGGENAHRGRALLQAASARSMPLDKARFLVNAYQSALFNRLLAGRLQATGRLAQMLVGDLAMFHASASLFPVLAGELAAAQTRADRGEIGPSAPLFGYKAPLAEGVPGAWERELLAEQGLALADFKTGGKRRAPKGERRRVRAFPEQLEWRVEGAGASASLHLAFTLAPGVYATTFLRELMKNDTLGCHLSHYTAPPATPIHDRNGHAN